MHAICLWAACTDVFSRKILMYHVYGNLAPGYNVTALSCFGPFHCVSISYKHVNRATSEEIKKNNVFVVVKN